LPARIAVGPTTRSRDAGCRIRSEALSAALLAAGRPCGRSATCWPSRSRGDGRMGDSHGDDAATSAIPGWRCCSCASARGIPSLAHPHGAPTNAGHPSQTCETGRTTAIWTRSRGTDSTARRLRREHRAGWLSPACSVLPGRAYFAVFTFLPDIFARSASHPASGKPCREPVPAHRRLLGIVTSTRPTATYTSPASLSYCSRPSRWVYGTTPRRIRDRLHRPVRPRLLRLAASTRLPSEMFRRQSGHATGICVAFSRIGPPSHFLLPIGMSAYGVHTVTLIAAGIVAPPLDQHDWHPKPEASRSPQREPTLQPIHPSHPMAEL